MKILILDHDLGFLFWMANVLEPFGYEVVPADKVSYALRLIRKWQLRVDLLMLNPCIEGAAEFTETLRRRMRNHLNVVVLVSGEQSLSDYQAIGADAVRTKPDARDFPEPGAAQAALQAEWVRFIQKILGSSTARHGAN